MSRLSTLSPNAIKAMFSPESSETIHVLLTLSGGGIMTPIRLSDGFNTRIMEDNNDVS